MLEVTGIYRWWLACFAFWCALASTACSEREVLMSSAPGSAASAGVPGHSNTPVRAAVDGGMTVAGNTSAQAGSQAGIEANGGMAAAGNAGTQVGAQAGMGGGAAAAGEAAQAGMGGAAAAAGEAGAQAGMGGAAAVDNDDVDAGSTDAPTNALATWFAALDNANSPLLGIELPPVAPLNNVTVRQIAHLSLGGQAIRIRLKNEYGAAPISFSKVRVAKSTSGAAIDPSTDTEVTFRGATSITLQPQGDVWSDDIALPVESYGDVAISLYVPGSADVATEHRFAQRTNYVVSGDATSEPAANRFSRTIESSYWMSEIVVIRADPADVVVAFGDSITDGFNSTIGANLRYPDQLSKLLGNDASGRARSVVNAGIGGNRWLHGGLGPAGTERFTRDVLDVTGVRDVVIMMGINDIGFGALSADEAVTLDQVTTAIAGAVMKARGAGLRVFLGTLPPFGDSLYYTEQGETLRQAVNAWILANKDANAVIDFDQLLRSPSNTKRYDTRYDSGDQLHPNDAGYAAMANLVNLALR